MICFNTDSDNDDNKQTHILYTHMMYTYSDVGSNFQVDGGQGRKTANYIACIGLCIGVWERFG